MSRTRIRHGASLAQLVTVALVTVVLAGAAGWTAAAVPAGGDTASQGPAGALAGSTGVTLEPTDSTVGEGNTTTLQVVVTDANGGVGAIDGEISVVDTSYATITDFRFLSQPDARDVSISNDGRRVSFRGALMNTDQTGDVAVGEVTIKGTYEGGTDVELSVSALGDESGDPYTVGATVDAAIDVENTKTAIPLGVSADTVAASVGEDVQFTVVRRDSDARVQAQVVVGGQRIRTNIDGRVTATITREMVTDSGTVTANVYKQATSQETFVNATQTIEIVAPSNDSDSPASNRSTPSNGGTAGTATVGFSSSSVSVGLDAQETVGVDVSNVDSGIGAAQFTVSLVGNGSASIVEAVPQGDPGIQNVTVGADGRTVQVRLALMDTPESPPIRILNLTLAGSELGSDTLRVAVRSLGSERGNSFSVGATPEASVSVSERVTTAVQTTTTPSTAGTETNPADQNPQPTTSSQAFGPGFTAPVALLALVLTVGFLRRRRS